MKLSGQKNLTLQFYLLKIFMDRLQVQDLTPGANDEAGA
jgi:hypothetical protein